MDEIRRILVFILCGISAVTALSGKAYYCRDPDTGKFHPANSTWPSTTFCGNYTCKLRKKVTPQVHLRELNLTKINLTQNAEARSEGADADGQFSASNITPQILIPVNAPDNGVEKTRFKSQLQDELNNIQERLKQKIDLEGGDRFLTETEIKTISDLLHNVKKSDLEAIVDIYNLAQDIYKEMDKMTSENIIEETMRFAQNFKARSNSGHSSYWYDPVNKYHKPDMEHQGSNTVPTTVQPQPVANPSTYFSGPLSRTDFGKLPYYYPLSSFQRQASYIHPAYSPQAQPQPVYPSYIPQPHPQPPPPYVKPPCSKNVAAGYPPPLPPQYYPPPQNLPPVNYPPPQSYPPPPQNYGGVLKRPFTVETQKQIQPSMLLPYPFSYIPHNVSSYPFNINYAENPWARFDVNNKNNVPSKTTNEQTPDNTITDTDTKPDKEQTKPKTDFKAKTEEEKANILDSKLLESLLNGKLHNKKPEWQTDPLPAKVLEEVRAHFEEKAKLFKPFSLRKKVKLERVGKVVKLDELHRERRSIDTGAKEERIEIEEDYEAFIEKTTCQSDNDPGFFRMGNLSEPYPACCPQRIDNNSR